MKKIYQFVILIAITTGFIACGNHNKKENASLGKSD